MSEAAPTFLWSPANADEIRFAANTVRGLAMDAIQRADSGHPGAPMGMADMAVTLWSDVLDYDPSAPAWPDRDRFVLSNGHASMLLYSMLFLSGTAFSMDDIQSFRQWGAKTAGHPEYGEAPGIETTTGPLGQGFANAVGMALAEAHLRADFGEELVDHYTYVFAGDGCLMEGVAYEAAALAGHLQLGRLVVLFDDNAITIDGSTDIATSEDITARFGAAGWQVLACDGHDPLSVRAALAEARSDTVRPSLIRCRTVIGFGSPALAGTSKCHGSPLGAAEVSKAKTALGLDPNASFVVHDASLALLRRNDAARRARREAWDARLAAHPRRADWNRRFGEVFVAESVWPTFAPGSKVATRKAGQAVLHALSPAVPSLMGGSADLAGSNGSILKGTPYIAPGAFAGRNIHFGIREHAMASLCNGLVLHGGVRPYCATFLVFHDYMRPAVRLAALMHQPVVYVYTHDSVYLGEDGPTHQPVEHLAAMRSIPNLDVMRPADGNETVGAWKYAMSRTDGPVAICLTRQDLPNLDLPAEVVHEGVRRGGYVVADGDSAPQVVIVSTGSEVWTALEARAVLEGTHGVRTRVVSLPCWERFFAQDADYRNSVLPPGIPRVSVEAGITFGWQAIVGVDGAMVGIDRFGASAPGPVVAEKLGIHPSNVVAAARKLIAGA